MEWNEKKKVDMKYIFTVPNIISYIRILLIAPFLVFFFQQKYIAAAVCIGVSALTDCFDGMLARALNQVTQLGKMLDPIADKLTLLAVGVGIISIEPMVIPVIMILIVKDLLLIAGGSVLLKKHLVPFAAQWYGKIGTILFYVSVGAIVLFELIIKVQNFGIVALVLLSLTALVMLYALYKYYRIYREMIKEDKLEKAAPAAESVSDSDISDNKGESI